MAGYNKKLGMSVTTIAGPSGATTLTCVSLDIESAFSTKKPEVQFFQESQAFLYPNIPEILLQRKPINELRQDLSIAKPSNLYFEGDQLMKKQGSGTTARLSAMTIPRSISFNGICENSMGA